MGISKKELLSIPPKIEEINRRRDRIAALRQKLYSPKGMDTNEKVQTSAGETAMLADIVIDMEAELERDAEDLNELRAEAAKIIETLPEEPRYVMRLRYLDEDHNGEPTTWSWTEIARLMYYSEATAHRRHGEALDILFPEEESE